MNAQATAELDAVTHACAAAEKERVAEEKKRMAAEKKAAAAEKQLANLDHWKSAHARYKGKLRELEQQHQKQIKKLRTQALQRQKRTDKQTRTFTGELEKQLATQHTKFDREMKRMRTLHAEQLNQFEMDEENAGEIDQIKRTECALLLQRLSRARAARHNAQRNTARKSLSIQDLRQKLRDKNFTLKQTEKEKKEMRREMQEQNKELEEMQKKLAACEAENERMATLLAQVPTLHKVREHKNMTWPVEYKAYIMQLLKLNTRVQDKTTR